ncbi:MAG: hypothetical protein ACXVBC_14285 [Bdellovibrionota bacterium]
MTERHISGIRVARERDRDARSNRNDLRAARHDVVPPLASVADHYIGEQQCFFVSACGDHYRH